MIPAILWRRLDEEGHEAARLSRESAGWLLNGTAVFALSGLPCRLDYRVSCDEAWVTRGATVRGWIGDAVVAVDLAVDAARRWRVNDQPYPAVTGCVDLDLEFSPATNLLPIRRLGLAPGAAAPVRAAWLRLPTFALEPLEQEYRRLDAGTYHYASGGGSFTATLAVSPDGFVTSYEGLWQLAAGRV